MRDEVKNKIDELKELFIDSDRSNPALVYTILNELPSTFKMQTDEIQYIHKFIWDYADRYGRKPMTPYFYSCILCQQCDGICDECLADWPINVFNEHVCHGKDGLYSEWVTAIKTGDKEKAHEYAMMIRDIPFKGGIN